MYAPRRFNIHHLSAASRPTMLAPGLLGCPRNTKRPLECQAPYVPLIPGGLTEGRHWIENGNPSSQRPCRRALGMVGVRHHQPSDDFYR